MVATGSFIKVKDVHLARCPSTYIFDCTSKMLPEPSFRVHGSGCVCRREDGMRVCRDSMSACNHSHTITVRFQLIPPMTFEQGRILPPQSEAGAGTSRPIRYSLTVTHDSSTQQSFSTRSSSFRSLDEDQVAGWGLQHMAGIRCNCSVHLHVYFSLLFYFFSILMYPINININVNVTSTDFHIQ